MRPSSKWRRPSPCLLRPFPNILLWAASPSVTWGRPSPSASSKPSLRKIPALVRSPKPPKRPARRSSNHLPLRPLTNELRTKRSRRWSLNTAVASALYLTVAAATKRWQRQQHHARSRRRDYQTLHLATTKKNSQKHAATMTVGHRRRTLLITKWSCFVSVWSASF